MVLSTEDPGLEVNRKGSAMKQNRWLWLRIVLMAVCVLLLGIDVGNYAWHTWKERFACDLTLRYYEIECIRTGVDPFDIFERTISSEEYVGIFRPDKPEEPRNGRKVVHSYTAWHMAFFWWNNFVPRNLCIVLMLTANIGSLAYVCKWISKKYRRSDTIHLIQDMLFLGVLMLYPFFCVFETLNYGLLLTGGLLLLFLALQCKYEILAGIAFAFIMIKPQVGVVLLVPLFFSKWYKTIAVAAAICIIGMLFTAGKLNKSPIELILQIPLIGAPFYKGFFTEMAFNAFGPVGGFVSMGVFILIAAVGCFLVRNAEEIWMRFLPALAIIPFWTYSMHHDWLIFFPCLIFILNCKHKFPKLYDLSMNLAILWLLAFLAERQKYQILGHTLDDTIFLLAILMLSSVLVVWDVNEDWINHNAPRFLPFLKKEGK